MPIRYRHYYIQKLVETVEKQNAEMNSKYGNKPSNEMMGPSKNKMPPPPIPDFATKLRAPKK